MPDPAVRAATSADTAGAAVTLAAAFQDDPVPSHLLPDPARRPARATRFFAVIGRVQLPFGHVYVRTAPAPADPPDGVAIWAPPGHWKLPTSTVVRNLPALICVFGAKTPAALGLLATMEKRHPPDPPHWYLEFVGTAPSRRGQGVALAVLAPILDQADAEGVPAYLENSSEVNLPLYSRLGFEVTGTFTAGKGGPTLWSMWREPRSG
ncbi:MAG TPA: GNAT family N-acetyltransferase [Acidimicrobiales bacterium]|nr:GNAT family N-acetyltransferase [Acidimicrobiales bacterium]